MACTLLDQLKSLVNQVDDCAGCCPQSPCPPPCPPPVNPAPTGCPPCPYPYAQVCMLTPPCIPAPTEPKYVKPLQLPSPCPPTPPVPLRDPEEDYQKRIANFYNNYNVDYHTSGTKKDCNGGGHRQKRNCNGVTVDGKNPRCEDYMKTKTDDSKFEGCPTGFKPCSMKLCAPSGCDPLGVWKATVQPCPPKPKKSVSNKYKPGVCRRPCCKHWKPKDGPCLYDRPCKAHCYDHPPGIKPTVNV